MAKCDDALPTVLANEGGFVNHPDDPGGATNYGVSLRFLRGMGVDFGDLDGDGDVDVDDVRRMTAAKAAACYRLVFWDSLGLDRLSNQAVATKLFDLSINMGKVRAVRLFQRALIRMGHPIVEDGDFGPATLAAANLSLPGLLLEQFRAQAKAFYSALIVRNPRLAAFRRGWHNRAMQ